MSAEQPAELEWLSDELRGKLAEIETPAFVIDLQRLQKNCEILQDVQQRSGAKILLALKGFAAWSCFDLIQRYLAGTAASGPHEAQLGSEHFKGEVHTYAPAFSIADLEACLASSDHIVFNSFGQWQKHRTRCLNPQPGDRTSKFGLRINPEHSEVKVPLYDPCRPGSRLGIPRAHFDAQPALDAELQGITGLHFHTLCELGSDALERTLEVVESKWADLLPRLQWVNFGGGHHITRPDYDVERLVRLLNGVRERYGVQVYLEPGEAIALDAGVLVSSVVDTFDNAGQNAIVDVSATAHMPDVLEMPYRPQILGPLGSPDEALAEEPGKSVCDVRLGGPTCLAGDVIGDYAFRRGLEAGDRLVFRDMAIYTMVKTTTFNGVHHPDIVLHGLDGGLRVVRRFTYEDYRNRLS